MKALPEALDEPPVSTEEYPFLLVSGVRRLARYNSWTHHIAPLAGEAGGELGDPEPARCHKAGSAEGQRVRSGLVRESWRSRRDSLPIGIHQFFGHNYETGTRSSRRFHVNVNFLHDDQVRDPFCGMPVFNGTPSA